MNDYIVAGLVIIFMALIFIGLPYVIFVEKPLEQENAKQFCENKGYQFKDYKAHKNLQDSQKYFDEITCISKDHTPKIFVFAEGELQTNKPT